MKLPDINRNNRGGSYYFGNPRRLRTYLDVIPAASGTPAAGSGEADLPRRRRLGSADGRM